MPISQVWHGKVASTAYCPSPHDLQATVSPSSLCAVDKCVLSVLSWYLPEIHASHSSSFVLKANPAAQNLQSYSVFTSSSWYLPISQPEQDDTVADVAYLPLSQEVQLVPVNVDEA